MKEPKNLIKTNISYGLIVLVPTAIIVLLIAKLAEILGGLAESIGLRSATSTVMAMFLAIVVLFLFCFIVGTLVRTRIGAWSFDKFERTVLKQVPGYEIINSVLKGFAEDRSAYPTALIQLFGPGTAVLGFVMEESEDGRVTVFIPSAPMVTAGTVHIVEREKVTFIDAGAIEVTECISHWGAGSRKIIEKY
jgi:uncharacterized membrane protein